MAMILDTENVKESVQEEKIGCLTTVKGVWLQKPPNNLVKNNGKQSQVSTQQNWVFPWIELDINTW